MFTTDFRSHPTVRFNFPRSILHTQLTTIDYDYGDEVRRRGSGRAGYPDPRKYVHLGLGPGKTVRGLLQSGLVNSNDC
jgi:hypothetical protein